jgi:hypothetical protein
MAQAQAAVEYAAKSATGALSGDGSGMHLGACRLDSTVIHCVKQFYPRMFYVAIVVICVLLSALMYPKSRI